jgi:hypothetical protein
MLATETMKTLEEMKQVSGGDMRQSGPDLLLEIFIKALENHLAEGPLGFFFTKT